MAVRHKVAQFYKSSNTLMRHAKKPLILVFLTYAEDQSNVAATSLFLVSQACKDVTLEKNNLKVLHPPLASAGSFRVRLSTLGRTLTSS